jgi:hypothetical protein
MDFVSGRADRSLAMLTMPHPAAPGETMTSGAIAKAISEMRYPPGPNRSSEPKLLQNGKVPSQRHYAWRALALNACSIELP